MTQTVFGCGTTCNLFMILYFNLLFTVIYTYALACIIMNIVHFYCFLPPSSLFTNTAYRHFVPPWIFLAFLGECETQ